jgi:hypothetical protein
MENQQSKDPRRTDPEKSDGGGGAASGTTVSVTVVRTGGFAGIRREWRAQPPADEAPRWIALIRECPWDAEDAQCPPAQPDRFVWRIDARLGETAHRTELPESHLHGPWRTLVAEVQSYHD